MKERVNFNHARIGMPDPFGNREEIDPAHDALRDEVMEQGMARHLG
jgi:hypothetical protein